MQTLTVIATIAISLIAMASRPRIPEATPEPEDLSRLPFQEQRWHQAKVRTPWLARVDSAVDRYVRTKNRYVAIERMRSGTSVPSRVIFVLHGRESTWSFAKHLHEGSSLRGRTRWVPKGRPRSGSPPFTFEESAEDALYKLKSMESWDWSRLHPLLQNIEKYNGLGYQKYHKDVPSPYLWAGTTIYSRGKYVADGRFSRLAVDKQLGCATVLKRMLERGIQ